MNKKAFILIFIILALCTLSLGYILWPNQRNSSDLEAYIYQDGHLLKTIDLTNVTAPYTFTIHSLDGGYNTIEVSPGTIRICDADCPDKLCQKMGTTDASLLPIICLPHSLVIQTKEKKDSQLDGISY